MRATVLSLLICSAVAGPAHAAAEELPPVPAELPAAARAYAEALQKRIQDLERRLNQGKGATPNPAASVPASGAPAAPPVPSARTLTAPLGSRLQSGGYAQVRLTNIGTATSDRSAPHDDADFQIPRFRPRLSYYLDPHWEAELQFNAFTRSTATAAINFRDVYLEYHNGVNNGYALRLGEQKVPFGYEIFVEGDEVRVPLERSRFEELLFPNERDIGAAALWNPRHLPTTQAAFRGPLLAVAVLNGNGALRQDNDQSKTVAATVRYPLNRWNTVGLSGSSGTFSPAPGHTFLKQLANLDWEGYYGRLRSRSELLLGRYLGHDINAGYGLLEYNTGLYGSPFVRYDFFDPDEDAAGDYWKRFTLGWYKNLTRTVRVTAEYDWVTNEAKKGTHHPDQFGVEVKSNF